MYPKPIQDLINIFSRFPTIGPRTAARFVFYLTKLSQEEVDQIAKSIGQIKKVLRICPSCFDAFADSEETKLCPICSDGSRNKELLCIVEKEADLTTLEETKKYKGLYFILGGTINLKKDKSIRIAELKEKIKNNGFKEIIIAINPTTEGEATSLLIERELKPFGIKMTRLGRGLPVGGELEYADPDTLSSALDSRR